ncbi:unnamed protein product [Meloidogyne enterolobii]|uniref:Uncharacterized protein n=1 Tax=Meloidogyne enterolobii TaxID=390850 RepID=A0ACB0ZCP7_MELEN
MYYLTIICPAPLLSFSKWPPSCGHIRVLSIFLLPQLALILLLLCYLVTSGQRYICFSL